MPPSSVAQKSARTSSIALRSTARLNATRSGTKVGNLEDSVRRLGQLLQSCLGLREIGGGRTKLGDALLEQRERGVEVELLIFEAQRDRLEARHTLFEAHEGSPDSGDSVTDAGDAAPSIVAVAAPSRKTSSTSSPARSACTERTVWPFSV